MGQEEGGEADEEERHEMEKKHQTNSTSSRKLVLQKGGNESKERVQTRVQKCFFVQLIHFESNVSRSTFLQSSHVFCIASTDSTEVLSEASVYYSHVFFFPNNGEQNPGIQIGGRVEYEKKVINVESRGKKKGKKSKNGSMICGWSRRPAENAESLLTGLILGFYGQKYLGSVGVKGWLNSISSILYKACPPSRGTKNCKKENAMQRNDKTTNAT